MERQVEPEWLDDLRAVDAGAIGSRRDLQRLNMLMGHARMIARSLNKHRAGRGDSGVTLTRLQSLVELGAGDGTFLLKVARRLVPATAILVDRQDMVSAETRKRFVELGLNIDMHQADVFEWLAKREKQEGSAMIVNLFLHHFREQQLRLLLRKAASQADLFVACEPRRSALALQASRMLGLIGCNAVTRHDAVVSVRAGFSGRELSNLWPAEAGSAWDLEEGKAGLFSHSFVARRK